MTRDTVLDIALGGAAGRMGRALARAIRTAPDLRLVGGTDLGPPQDLGALAGEAPSGAHTAATVAEAAAKARCWIDFSTPAALSAALPALPQGVSCAIIGVTGLDAAAEDAIAAAAQRLAVVRSGNFSVGVQVLAGLVREAARRLGPEWDIEILEAHHRRKVDAPSGTALLLGEAAAAGRRRPLPDLRLPARDGITGARPEGAIGFATIRAGGIVGEHEVIFGAEREALRLSHQAFDRAVFADGALAAARWAADQPPGLYSMQDVLGLFT